MQECALRSIRQFGLKPAVAGHRDWYETTSEVQWPVSARSGRSSSLQNSPQMAGSGRSLSQRFCQSVCQKQASLDQQPVLCETCLRGYGTGSISGARAGNTCRGSLPDRYYEKSLTSSCERLTFLNPRRLAPLRKQAGLRGEPSERSGDRR